LRRYLQSLTRTHLKNLARRKNQSLTRRRTLHSLTRTPLKNLARRKNQSLTRRRTLHSLTRTPLKNLARRNLQILAKKRIKINFLNRIKKAKTLPTQRIRHLLNKRIKQSLQRINQRRSKK